MKGLTDILTRVKITGKPETIVLNDSKETTKVCRDIDNRINYTKGFWDLQYKRINGNTIKIWRMENG